MLRNRLPVQADYRLLRIIWPLVHFQHVLHVGDVVFIEFGHYRGRDAGHPAPAQIPTRGIPRRGLNGVVENGLVVIASIASKYTYENLPSRRNPRPEKGSRA